MNESNVAPSGRARREYRVGLTALAGGIALFSTSPVLIAGAQTNGLAVGFWRVWISGAALVLVVAYQKGLSREAIRLAALPGIAFGVSTALFFTSVQITSVANASVIAVLNPIPLLIAGRLFFGERPRVRDVAWIALALGGVFVIVLSAGSAETGDIKGDLLAASALLTMTVYFVAAKIARRSVDTLPFMVGIWIWSGVVITPIMIVSDKAIMPVTGTDWLRIAAIAALPGTGHILINYSHQQVPLAIVGVFHLFMPVGSALLALWFLDQSITGWQTLGMIVVLSTLTAYTLQQPDQSDGFKPPDPVDD